MQSARPIDSPLPSLSGQILRILRFLYLSRDLINYKHETEVLKFMEKAGNTICFMSTHNMSNLTYKFIPAFMWLVFMFVVHVSAVYTEKLMVDEYICLTCNNTVSFVIAEGAAIVFACATTSSTKGNKT